MKRCSLLTLLIWLFVYRLPYAEAGGLHTPDSQSVVIASLVCGLLYLAFGVVLMSYLKAASREIVYE